MAAARPQPGPIIHARCGGTAGSASDATAHRSWGVGCAGLRALWTDTAGALVVRTCRRALDHPDAEPQEGDEAAAVARYEALLAPPRRESIPRGLDACGRLK